MFPDYWKSFTNEHDLIGASACLDEAEDLSGMGVDLQILTEPQSEEELTLYWPGSGVAADGFVPVASCLMGSGDCYYIRQADGPGGPLYRIYHDAVSATGYDPKSAVDRVLESYVQLLHFIER